MAAQARVSGVTMASGLPDFYRSIDIAKQTLPELFNRPKFGGGILSSGQLAVTDGVLNSLVQINGKGMVYGGSIWLDYTASQANSEIWLGIDGVNIEGLSLIRLRDFGVVEPGSAVITLNKFDSVNFIYSVGISYGLTFETRLDLKYNENHSATPTVHFRIIYTLI